MSAGGLSGKQPPRDRKSDGDGRDGSRPPIPPAKPARDGLTSLSGDITAFHAYDICQFLGFARATGTLILRTMGVRGAIYFEDGRVVGARSRPHPRRFGSLLVENGGVDEASLGRAVAAQIAGDRRTLGEILLASGAVSRAALGAASTAQARSALAALLVLPSGRFAFARGLLPPGDHQLDADPQQLVLDALTRLDELNAGHIPSDRAE